MSGRDIAASVRQRLLSRARAEGRPFQELLQYFAMERFLYRLANSPFAGRFVLKGALLLTAWKTRNTKPCESDSTRPLRKPASRCGLTSALAT